MLPSAPAQTAGCTVNAADIDVLLAVERHDSPLRGAGRGESSLPDGVSQRLSELVARERGRRAALRRVEYMEANLEVGSAAADETELQRLRDAAARMPPLQAADVQQVLDEAQSDDAQSDREAFCRWRDRARYTAGVSPRRTIEDRARAYQRPYGDRAPWNVPVRDLPRHPDSDRYAGLLFSGKTEGPGRLSPGSQEPGRIDLALGAYTFPVYRVGEANGQYPVTITSGWVSNLHGQTMPWNPVWQPSAGSDGQVIVTDPDSGREWNLWQVVFDGSRLVATNGNLIPGSYWVREEGFVLSRGVGIPYLAMLVTPEEIARGRIDHALAMAVRNSSGRSFVPPATKLEFGDHPEGIPEGMRFALDVTEEDIDAWVRALPAGVPEGMRRFARVVAVALREYGWFITDSTGTANLKFEAVESALADWQTLGVLPEVRDSRRPHLTYPRRLLTGLLTPARIYAVVPSDQYPPALRARRLVPTRP